jgi:hypothetical protein
MAGRLRAACLAAVLTLTFSAAACGPFDDDSSSSGSAPLAGGGGGGGNNGGKAGCSQAGPLTKDFLPLFPPGTTKMIENPCLKLVGLVSEVTGLIPEGDRGTVTEFLGKVGDLADRAAKVGDAVECGYETDRLALAIYQDKKTLWSIGVTAVVRGDIDAVVEGALCYLLKQLPFGLGQGVANPENPQFMVCVDAQRRHRGNDDYTVLWLGSSDVMCDSLTRQLKPGERVGDEITAAVKASPTLMLRATPSTSAEVLFKLDAGDVVTVSCWTEGEKVSGRRGSSTRWDKTNIGTIEGYLADVWLDTGDNPTVPAC